MKALPSFLKDTIQLINELNNLQIEDKTILVTIDVKYLYTCIFHKEGIQACIEALRKTVESNPNQPNTETLIKLLEIGLRYNTFEFDGKCYIQLRDSNGEILLQLMLTFSWAN